MLPERPIDIRDLVEAARAIWWSKPPVQIDGMIDSMPRRLQAVQEQHGYPISYSLRGSDLLSLLHVHICCSVQNTPSVPLDVHLDVHSVQGTDGWRANLPPR